MFDSMYLPDERDRAIFGDLYEPPSVFVHSEWHQVATIQPPDDGGVRPVAIDECRMPARFFRLRLLPGTNYKGDPLTTNVEITTGSGDEMGKLLVSIGREITRGMICIEVVP